MLSAMRAVVAQHGSERKYWIGYSGGLDSHVLLSLLCELRNELQLNIHALHINHNLSPHANTWAQHCQRICAELNIPCEVETLTLAIKAGASIENSARIARYAAFARYVDENSILLTAHQQDDQAETFLLQLLRGAGVKGLAAMPQQKFLAHAQHVRPLLAFPRTELESYARAQQLQWIQDESNLNTQFSRNFLRQQIFPLVKQHWPGATESIARSAEHCAASQVLLEEFAQDILANAQGSKKNTLSVKKLLILNSNRQRLALRTWIHANHFPLPSTAKITALQNDVLHAAWDRLPQLTWGPATLRRYRDDLYLMRKALPHANTQQFNWDFLQPLELPGVGVLHAIAKKGAGVRADIKNISIRYRHGGESVTLPKRGRHTLKNLFHEWNVLPWERDRLPLLFFAEQCIAAVNYFIDPEFIARPDAMGWEIFLAPT